MKKRINQILTFSILFTLLIGVELTYAAQTGTAQNSLEFAQNGLVILQVGHSTEVVNTVQMIVAELKVDSVPMKIISIDNMNQLPTAIQQSSINQMAIVSHGSLDGISQGVGEVFQSISWQLLGSYINTYRNPNAITYFVSCDSASIRSFLSPELARYSITLWNGPVDTEIAAKLTSAFFLQMHNKVTHALNLMTTVLGSLLNFLAFPRHSLDALLRHHETGGLNVNAAYYNIDLYLSTPFITTLVELALNSFRSVISHILPWEEVVIVLLTIEIIDTIIGLLFNLATTAAFMYSHGVPTGAVNNVYVYYLSYDAYFYDLDFWALFGWVKYGDRMIADYTLYMLVNTGNGRWLYFRFIFNLQEDVIGGVIPAAIADSHWEA